MRGNRWLGLLAVFAAVSALAVGVASSSLAASGRTSVPTATPAWLAAIQANVAAAYKGKYLELPTSGPKGLKGKKIWDIQCLLVITSCAQASQGIRAAGKALGWKVTTVDDKLDPTLTAQYVQRAIAAKADAIILTAADCASIKNALTQAKAAKIPVIGISVDDCSPSLYTAIPTVAGLIWNKGVSDRYVPLKADWGIVKTGGQMKAIVVHLTDLASPEHQVAAFKKELAKCPTCSVVDDVNVTVGTLNTLQQLLSASLVQHPEANAVFMYDGSALANGVQTAIQQSGRQNSLVVMGGPCSAGEIPLMRQGWNIGCSAFSIRQGAWEAVDYVNRVLSGQTKSQLPKFGTAVQLIDATHNLPAGDTWEPPIKYQAAYKKIWGVK